MKFLGIIPCNAKQYKALNEVSGGVLLTAGIVASPVWTFLASAGFNMAKEAIDVNRHETKKRHHRKRYKANGTDSAEAKCDKYWRGA